MADAHAPPIPSTASESPSPPPPPPPQRYYNLGSILSSAKDVKSSAQVTAAAEGVLGSACFRTAGLWAIAVSAAFAAHRFKQGGSPRRMLNDALLAGLLTFGTQWYICRNAEVDRRATFKAFYMRRPPDAAPRPAPGDDDGELADAVDRELARVTRTELPEVVVRVGLDGQPLARTQSPSSRTCLLDFPRPLQ